LASIEGVAKRRFHGYQVAAVAFLEYGIAVGAVYFVAAPLVAVLIPALKLSLGVISGVFLMRSLLGLLGPAFGWLVHKFGAKQIIIVGGILTAVFTALTAVVTNVFLFYLVFGAALAIADGLMGYLPVFTTVNQWFVKRRGFVMGIVAAAGGIGGFVFAPLMQLLIQGFGNYRPALVTLGAIIFVLGVVPAIIWLYNRPSDLQEYPDGDPSSASLVVSEQEGPSWTVFDALKTPQCWLLMFVFGVEAWALGVYAADQVVYLKTVGISPLAASTALGATGLIAAVVGFLVNMLSDHEKIGPYWVLLIATVLMTIGSIVFFEARSLAMVYLYVVLFGAGYGTLVPVIPTALGKYFGARNYALVYGWGSILVVLMAGLGPLVTGILVDATKSFALGLEIVIGLLVLSVIAAAAARPPAKTAAY